MSAEARQILALDGTQVGETGIALDDARALYRAMVAARLYDLKGTALQRQGRLATYAPFQGQEAAQIGAAATLRDGDWLVATYRDAAAMWFRGYPWELLLLQRIGDERGGAPPIGIDVLPASITVGAHMVHAVGLSWASALRGGERVAMTMFGDGATSEGDFHEAMNFAGVFKTPTVFFCQNNHYAISTPRMNQTASRTIAMKADAYGMPGIVVDGNDALAVFETCSEAVERARAGSGPTLIEAVTYRVGPHTTADDPSRYRSSEEEAEWSARDPIERLRRYLEARGVWDEQWQALIEAEERVSIEEAVSAAEASVPQPARAMFEAMFATLTPQLETQLQELASFHEGRDSSMSDAMGSHS